MNLVMLSTAALAADGRQSWSRQKRRPPTYGAKEGQISQPWLRRRSGAGRRRRTSSSTRESPRALQKALSPTSAGPGKAALQSWSGSAGNRRAPGQRDESSSAQNEGRPHGREAMVEQSWQVFDGVGGTNRDGEHAGDTVRSKGNGQRQQSRAKGRD